MSLITMFGPEKDSLNIMCLYLYYKCVKNGGVKKEGTWRMLKVPGRILEDRFIFDVMDELV